MMYGMLQPLCGICSLYVGCFSLLWDVTASMRAAEVSVWAALTYNSNPNRRRQRRRTKTKSNNLEKDARRRTRTKNGEKTKSQDSTAVRNKKNKNKNVEASRGIKKIYSPTGNLHRDQKKFNNLCRIEGAYTFE